jgi:hypothetical protein
MPDLYSKHEYVDNARMIGAWDEINRGIARLYAESMRVQRQMHNTVTFKNRPPESM